MNWCRPLQKTIEFVARPYIVRELPAWGKVYSVLVGSYRRDWLWKDAQPKTMREKITGRLMHLNISRWVDRSTYFLGRWYDLETHLLIDKLVMPGDTVVDVGANRGLFTFLCAHRVGIGGRVICFEPNPLCVRSIERELQENAVENVSLYRFGLGDRDTELTLSVPPINSGEATFGPARYDNAENIEVAVRVGDTILADEMPTLIKLDIEGYEFHALVGLEETIKHAKPVIITELNADYLRSCGSSSAELMALMERFGYHGFVLDLQHSGMRHMLQLTPIRKDTSGVDVVWLPSAPSDRQAKFLQRNLMPHTE
jgi:FkbM family methyltransferase